VCDPGPDLEGRGRQQQQHQQHHGGNNRVCSAKDKYDGLGLSGSGESQGLNENVSLHSTCLTARLPQGKCLELLVLVILLGSTPVTPELGLRR
jgi:hypothetical protein